MRKILFTVLCTLLVIPFFAKADENKYTSLNLEGALADEQIEKAFSSYTETDDKITIYLFRGKGCGYCRNFLTFLNSITEEYGKYFKLESYEVWYNKDNSSLLSLVSNFLEQPAKGVPYVIIGDKIFPGYSNRYDDQIKEAIVDLYNSTNRYDALKEMEKAGYTGPSEDPTPSDNKDDKKDPSGVREENTYSDTSSKNNDNDIMNSILMMIPSIAISLVGIVSILVISSVKNKAYMANLNSVENELKLVKEQLKEQTNNKVKTDIEENNSSKKTSKKAK